MAKGYKPFIYLLFSLSGFCALVYEVLWTRYLSLTFGTTIVAASVVAATFMAGLASGSYLFGRYADRQSNLLRVYALLELGIALTALLFPPTLQLVEMKTGGSKTGIIIAVLVGVGLLLWFFLR